MADITGMLQAAAGVGGEAPDTDPNFNQTVLLLHGDGTNGAQNNTFLDSSTNNFTITRAGNTTQGSFSPFGRTSGNLDDVYDPAVNGGSGYFDGVNDYLQLADDADFDLGTNAFCIEAWIYPLIGTGQTIFGQWDSGSTSGQAYTFGISSSNLLFVYRNSGGTYVGDLTVGALTLNAWNHVVVCRDASNNWALFVDGTRTDTSTQVQTIRNLSTTLRIGATNDAASDFNGYISSLRVVNGSSVYDPTSTTLTVPTAPLTAISNTVLLCNFTNAGIFDNTGKNNLETVGNAQIDTTTKKYGTGSMEFDGSGDYLISQHPNPTVGLGASEDFTLEMFFYPTNNNSSAIQTLFQLDGTDNRFWLRYYNTSGFYVYLLRQIGGGSGLKIINSTASLTLNTWQHIMLSRSSGTVYLYIDGIYITSATMAEAFSSPIIRIGYGDQTVDPMYGFLDEVRFTRGVARHSGATNFTVPTSAYPDQ